MLHIINTLHKCFILFFNQVWALMVISIVVEIVSLYTLDFCRSQIHKLQHKNDKTESQSNQSGILERSSRIEKSVLFIFGVIQRCCNFNSTIILLVNSSFKMF